MAEKPVINKEYFEKAKQHLLTKEQRQKAEDEAKLLGTAMQQLLAWCAKGAGHWLKANQFLRCHNIKYHLVALKWIRTIWSCGIRLCI